MLTQVSEDRRDRMFHPSDLSGVFCPRAWSLYNYHPRGLELKEASIDPRTARIFGNGHYVHQRVQSYFQGSGVIYGTWRKLVGWDANDEPKYVYHTGFPPSGNGWEYCEVRLSHPADRILGSTDGLLRLNYAKYGLEVKSIKNEYFKELKDQPLKHHREQTFIYMHCLEHTRQELLQKSKTSIVDPFEREPLQGFIILYENKNDQHMKEFFVPYEPQAIEEMMQRKRKLMHLALEYERTGEHPRCRCPLGRPSVLCKAIPEED